MGIPPEMWVYSNQKWYNLTQLKEQILEFYIFMWKCKFMHAQVFYCSRKESSHA